MFSPLANHDTSRRAPVAPLDLKYLYSHRERETNNWLWISNNPLKQTHDENFYACMVRRIHMQIYRRVPGLGVEFSIETFCFSSLGPYIQFSSYKPMFLSCTLPLLFLQLESYLRETDNWSPTLHYTWSIQHKSLSHLILGSCNL